MDKKNSKIEEVIETLTRHHKIARVVIVSTKGSAPRKAHSHMIVTEQQAFGSIGGGQLEYQVTCICQQALLSVQKFDREVRRFALGPSLGQCCGGSVSALIEYFHHSDLPELEIAASATPKHHRIKNHVQCKKARRRRIGTD